MSIGRHFILFIYAVLIALLALVLPLGIAVFSNGLFAAFKCIDKGSYLVCATPWLSDLSNFLSVLMVILWGLLIVILWIAGFAALLLLVSLFLRLSILLAANFIIRVGR